MNIKLSRYTLLILLNLIFSSVFCQINFERNDSIVVIETNGDTLKNPWAGGFNSVQFSEIDLNLDGIMDLFVFDRTGNRMSTFINQGIPNQITYKHAPSYVQYFPKNIQGWALLRDYNCDGKIDLIGSTIGKMTAYKNTSTTELNFTLDEEIIKADLNPDGLISGNNPTGGPYMGLIYISIVDIPAIDDIDNDGDLDILTFSQTGSYINYYKNLSMERYGNCDSLDFQLRNDCWGFFKENLSTNSVTLYDTCDYNNNVPEKTATINKKHAGSTLLTLDMDANNSKELVLGDVSFNNFVMLTNGDNSPNLDHSSMIASDSQFPQNNNSTIAVDIDVFPAAYYLDVNNDNIKDLVAATNCQIGCSNKNNIWLFNNLNVDNNPNFSFSSRSFLQDEMIDIGEGAHPIFFDYNADGLMDIIVGSYGEYAPSSGANLYNSSLHLYENIGTINQPSYQLVNTDYLGISSMNLDISASMPTLGLHPAFGDLDNDGDLDMILGDYNGKIHYFTNSAGPGNPPVISLLTPNYLNLDVGQNATPFIYDLDGDNLLDLVIGKKTGYISYYHNEGSANSPNFVFVTDTFGNIDTKDYFHYNGNSAPVLIDSLGTTLMYSGSASGYIYKFGNIDGNLTGTFSRDSNYLNLWDGINSNISLSDITNDGALDLLIGNYAGGISFYKGTETPNIVKIQENLSLNNFSLYPNPTKNTITIDIKTNQIKNASIQVLNLLGKKLLTQKVSAQQTTIPMNHLASGIYLVQFSNELGSKVFKVLKE